MTPKGVPSTQMRHECMTPSLNIVSIKKWQNQTNDYNTPKQDMHYEKIPADFILFPPYGLVVRKWC